MGQTGKDHGGSTSMVGGGSMIFTTADPTLWKEEASRVSSRLVAAGNERLHRVHGMVIGSDSSWVSHYEVLKDFAIKNNLMGSADRNKTEENVEMISEIHGGIKSLVRENNTQLSSIKRTEASLANSSSLQIHSVIFGEIKRGLTSTEAHVAVLTKSLEEKSAELSEIEDLLEVVGEKYNERTGGGGGGGEDSHGTGGLVKVKTALRLLKEELAELELREGMTSNELLNLRKQQNVLNLEKQHQRRRKGKYHKTGSVSELDD